MISQNGEFLKKLGFDFELDDTLDIRILGVPLALSKCSSHDILDDFFATVEQELGTLEKNIDRLIMKSCKRAIKAGHKIDYSEAEYLIEEFINSGGIPNCPHGRPIMAVLTENEIKKYFRRIV